MLSLFSCNNKIGTNNELPSNNFYGYMGTVPKKNVCKSKSSSKIFLSHFNDKIEIENYRIIVQFNGTIFDGHYLINTGINIPKCDINKHFGLTVWAIDETRNIIYIWQTKETISIGEKEDLKVELNTLGDFSIK